MIELTPLLHRDSKTPLYAQLYHYIKKEIETGNVPSGELLPSIRRLSLHLQISKNTVEGAYQQLLAEGYVESIPRVGLKVLKLEEPFASNTDKRISSYDKVTEREKRKPGPKMSGTQIYDFVYGDVDVEHFPKQWWKKYIQEAFEDETGDVFMYGDPLGDFGLREELSSYLLQSRGVHCHPEQIVITPGTQHAISLLCQLLSLYGLPVAIEEPGYDGVRSVFINQGCSIEPIPLEKDGIDLSILHSSKANLVYVTPSHQLPQGMILPIQKRLELLQWAEKNRGYILEDDYDSEFRYQGQPIPALKALDKKENVIYLGTFSKCFLPAARVSYLVLPPKLAETYKKKFHNYNQASSPIIQKALYLFMKSGDFERHIRRMKKVYQAKHQTLMKSLKEFFNDQIEVIGERSGLHVLMKVKGRSEQQLIAQAMHHQVKVYSLSKFSYSSVTDCAMIMLGFGKLSEEEIAEGVRRLHKAWMNESICRDK